MPTRDVPVTGDAWLRRLSEKRVPVTADELPDRSAPQISFEGARVAPFPQTTFSDGIAPSGKGARRTRAQLRLERYRQRLLADRARADGLKIRLSQSWEAPLGREAASDVDPSPPAPHDSPMSATERDLFQAKLETLETKIDGRIARIEDAIGRLAIDVSAGRNDMRDDRRHYQGLFLGGLLTVLATLAGSVWSIKSDIKTTTSLEQDSRQAVSASNEATLAATTVVLEQIEARREELKLAREAQAAGAKQLPATPDKPAVDPIKGK
jgi:hypothetical protein